VSDRVDVDGLLAAALEGAVLAATVTRKVQAEDTLSSLSKAGDEPVTVADYAAQAVILRAIAAFDPRPRIVSEEASEHLREKQSRAVLERARELVGDAIGEPLDHERLCRFIDHEGDERCRIAVTIDPIDGTKGFLRREQYAIAIGVLDGGEPIGGVLVCPNLPSKHVADRVGVIFVAQRGGGAFERPLDGGELRRIAVAKERGAEQVRHGDPRLVDDLIEELGLRGGEVRYDSQVKYGVLARGDAEIYLRPRSKPTWRDHVWDHAGGVLVASEAGARISDQEGHALDFATGRRLENNRGVLASHGPLHDAIVAALARIESRAP
jgi:HAL2 family 3'(2'),5'-bisphosphate nucleotidase